MTTGRINQVNIFFLNFFSSKKLNKQFQTPHAQTQHIFFFICQSFFLLAKHKVRLTTKNTKQTLKKHTTRKHAFCYHYPFISIFSKNEKKKIKTNSFSSNCLLFILCGLVYPKEKRNQTKNKKNKMERNNEDAKRCDFSQTLSIPHSVQFYSTKLKQLSQSFNAQLIPLLSNTYKIHVLPQKRKKVHNKTL